MTSVISMDHLVAYFAKSGDTDLSGDKMVSNEHGFLTYSIKNSVFELHNVFGDGKYWQPEMERIARESGCLKIICGTWRNPFPMCRKYGYKVIKTGSILEKEL